MRQIDPAMTASGTLCHCWKMVLRARPSATPQTPPVSYGFTDHDRALTFDDLTYEAASGFTASAIENGLGLKIDNLEVAGALSSEALSEEAINKGLFDGAEIYIYRVNWQNTDQRVLLRRGNIGEIHRTASGFTAELRGIAHRLSYPNGRLYQSLCDADFGDARCKENIQTYTYQASIESFSGDRRIVSVSGVAHFDTGWFAQGKLVFQSGANQDRVFDIRSSLQEEPLSKIELWVAPTQPIAIGDTVSLLAGCDKRFETCRMKFDNDVNFQGFPHIPGNDYVQFYPRG